MGPHGPPGAVGPGKNSQLSHLYPALVMRIAQERAPDCFDKLIVYDGGRYHIITISPSQQPGFPIVNGS